MLARSLLPGAGEADVDVRNVVDLLDGIRECFERDREGLKLVYAGEKVLLGDL
jgi:hypothetical protein